MSDDASPSSVLTWTPQAFEESYIYCNEKDKSEDLQQVNNALEAYLVNPKEPKPGSSQPFFERNLNVYRFLRICKGNGYIFEVARRLIKDVRYWAMEDDHFEKLIDSIHDYNGTSEAGRWRIAPEDVRCPPLEVIKRLIHEREYRAPTPVFPAASPSRCPPLPTKRRRPLPRQKSISSRTRSKHNLKRRRINDLLGAFLTTRGNRATTLK